MISIYDAAAAHLVGSELGASRWLLIDQQRIDAFAHVTEDLNRIHVDVPWAGTHSAFGATIAHGFLSVALLSVMLNDVVVRPADEASTLNYGFDKLRMLSPVMAGKRIRGRFSLNALSLRSPTQYRASFGVTVDIEGEDKPALVADWLIVTNLRTPRAMADAASA